MGDPWERDVGPLNHSTSTTPGTERWEACVLCKVGWQQEGPIAFLVFLSLSGSPVNTASDLSSPRFRLQREVPQDELCNYRGSVLSFEKNLMFGFPF